MNRAGKNKRFIRLNQNASLEIGNNSIRLRHGLVEYGSVSSIYIEEGGVIEFSHVTLNGTSGDGGNSIGIDIEHPERIDLLDVYISNLTFGIDVGYNSELTQVNGLPEFKINACRIQNCEVDRNWLIIKLGFREQTYC